MPHCRVLVTVISAHHDFLTGIMCMLHCCCRHKCFAHISMTTGKKKAHTQRELIWILQILSLIYALFAIVKKIGAELTDNGKKIHNFRDEREKNNVYISRSKSIHCHIVWSVQPYQLGCVWHSHTIYFFVLCNFTACYQIWTLFFSLPRRRQRRQTALILSSSSGKNENKK